MADDQLNVLVIDDDPAMVQLLTEIILRAEHQVMAVHSAERGLELLPFWTFQVAFIDQRLPGMEGLVLGEYLRHNNPDMTIALVTGDDDKKLERQSRALEIVHISKPFQVAEIDAVLEGSAAAARERHQKRARRADPDYAPRFSMHVDDIASRYDMPNVPSRVSDKLLETLKRSLHNLRSVSRYTERERLVALSGLLCAKVLGIDLPRASPERTMYEEYDALMRLHGRRAEFSHDARDDERGAT